MINYHIWIITVFHYNCLIIGQVLNYLKSHLLLMNIDRQSIKNVVISVHYFLIPFITSLSRIFVGNELTLQVSVYPSPILSF